MKKAERDHHQQLLSEIKALRKALAEERAETTRDVGRLDEDLSRQIKSTADRLKSMVQGWNKQQQEYFDKQAGNLFCTSGYISHIQHVVKQRVSN